ncbi:hypothetical protein MMC07_004553 [Pseudocyphellaria aurata]|nr:hypothetical protein [Pseudocyphellaria aurata]
MTLNLLDVGLPGWEILHILQDAEMRGKNTGLLLRRTNPMEAPFAVDKIVPVPNIIKLIQSHVDVSRPGSMSLIFENCACGNLAALATHAQQVQEPIPEAILWHVLHQAWAALEHMHRHDISHDNLHMGNVFLRPIAGGGPAAYPDAVLAVFERADRSAIIASRHVRNRELSKRSPCTWISRFSDPSC